MSHSITRRQTLAVLGTASVAHLWPMFFASAAPLRYQITPKKIADGVWAIYGANEAITRSNGGAIANIAILDTRDGAVIIDTGPSLRYGKALRAIAEELTGKSIARVYITHFHPDHVFGNQAFASETLAAPKGVIDGLRVSGEDFATAMYHLAGDWMRGTELVLPKKIIAAGIEEIGERRLRHLILKGHTATDLAIYDERSGILFSGDVVFLDRAPTTPHADVSVWHASLDQLEEMKPSKIVPGHGPVEAGDRGVRQTRDWLNTVEGVIRGAFDRGLTMTEAFAEPLPDWTKKVALARYEFERSVMHLYPRLETNDWPRVDKK